MKPKILDHGLNKRQIQIIKDILSSNTNDIKKVSLYGSRATGKYKTYSDIDLVLYGDIKESVSGRLWTCFSESYLPYKVDVTVYKNIVYLPLKRHIDAHAKILFTKEELYSTTRIN